MSKCRRDHEVFVSPHISVQGDPCTKSVHGKGNFVFVFTSPMEMEIAFGLLMEIGMEIMT